jgi:2-oxoglutarate ferredoxin oxidoreductase subunit beta
MTHVLRAAAEHQGAAFVEIYQNCPVFNDGAFDALRDRKRAAENRIPLVHGEPIRFGERGVVRDADGRLRIADEGDFVVHDAHCDDPSLAFALAHLAAGPAEPTPIGVFRQVGRPVHGVAASEDPGRTAGDVDALGALLHDADTWTVSAR